MNVIYKYPLTITDYQELDIPSGATLLDAQFQNGQLVLWALCSQTEEMGKRAIYIRGTGNKFTHILGENYLKSVQEGNFVWHIFHRYIFIDEYKKEVT